MPTPTLPNSDVSPIRPIGGLTADDYRKTPEGPPWYELIDGHLIEEPSPTDPHQHFVGEVFAALLAWAKRQDAGIVRVAPFDVYLSERNVVQPDVLFVAAARRAICRYDGVYGPPDLVVEALSPSNAKLTRTRKPAIYAESGVGELWLADPVLRSLSVFRFKEDPFRPVETVGTGDLLRSPLLPGFEIAATELFPAR